MSRSRPIVRRSIALGVDTLTLVAATMPRWSVYALADAGGMLTYFSWRRGRRNAERNFAHVLGEAAGSRRVRCMARRSFAYYGRMGADLLRHRRLTLARLREEIRAEGLEHLDAALQRGKGVILVAPHLGNWETGVSLGCFLKHNAVAVAEDGFVGDLVLPHRERAGLQIVARSRSVRPLLRALAKNDIAILVCDLAKDMRASEVAFFGRPSRMPLGPAQLARKTGAALVPIYAIRDADQKTLVRIEPALPGIATDEPDRDAQQMSQAIANAFARIIRAHLGQWYPYGTYWDDGVDVS